MKGFCKNKHDLSILGRFKNGNCKACDKGARRRQREKKLGANFIPPGPKPGPPKWAIPVILALGERMDLAHGPERDALEMETFRLRKLPLDHPSPPADFMRQE
jgi:hypothetical protein